MNLLQIQDTILEGHDPWTKKNRCILSSWYILSSYYSR